MRIISIALAVCLAPLPALAEVQTQATDSIAQLNEQIAVMSGRVKLLEMESQLATKRNEIAKLNGVSSLSDEAGMPVLKAIDGVDGIMTASLQYDDGAKVNVQKNDVLQDGWLVASIGHKSIFLEKGKKKIRLLLRMPSRNPSLTTGAVK